MGRPLALYGAPGFGAYAERVCQGWQTLGFLAKHGLEAMLRAGVQDVRPGPHAEQDAQHAASLEPIRTRRVRILTGLINKKARRFGGPSLMARPEDYGGLSCPPPFGPAPKRRCSKSLPAILSNSADHNVGSSNVSGRLKQKAHLSVGFLGSYGAPGEIRTPDHLVRSQVLYPAELRAHLKLFCITSLPVPGFPPVRTSCPAARRGEAVLRRRSPARPAELRARIQGCLPPRRLGDHRKGRNYPGRDRQGQEKPWKTREYGPYGPSILPSSSPYCGRQPTWLSCLVRVRKSARVQSGRKLGQTLMNGMRVLMPRCLKAVSSTAKASSGLPKCM